MRVGFSLSPGGLLLPYHLGALQCLQEQGVLPPEPSDPSKAVAVAGASAGAIATMTYGCGIPNETVLEAAIAVSDACKSSGARGNLLPLLRDQMESIIGEEEFDYWKTHSGNARPAIGIAYRQVFPRQQNYLQTTFDDREDLFRAVSFSCMFPFFATNGPCIWDTSQGILSSRLMVDGLFTVPKERAGCPDFGVWQDSVGYNGFPLADTVEEEEDDDEVANLSAENNASSDSTEEDKVDRTVAICCFPQSSMKATAFDPKDCISPDRGMQDWLPTDFIQVATQSTSRQRLTSLYNLGYENAQDWCEQEEIRKEEPAPVRRRQKVFTKVASLLSTSR